MVFYGYAPALGLWLMKLYGHPDVRILDCSRDTWRAGGYPWSTAASEPPTGGFRLGGEDCWYPGRPGGGTRGHRPAGNHPGRRPLSG